MSAYAILDFVLACREDAMRTILNRHVLEIFSSKQTIRTLIRVLPLEQSDLGP